MNEIEHRFIESSLGRYLQVAKTQKLDDLMLSATRYQSKEKSIYDFQSDLGEVLLKWNAIESGIQTGDFTKMGSQADMIASALDEIAQ